MERTDQAGEVGEMAYAARVVYAPALRKPYVAYSEELLTDKPDEVPEGYFLGGEGDSPEEAIAHLQRSLEARTGRPCRAVHIRYAMEPADDAHEGL